MDKRRYVIADVFADVPLEGNQVAVFTDARGIGEDAMQRLARELNLSETVFVLPGGEEAHATIRIFTPSRELPFAGHPVLGTAFVLGTGIPAPVIRLKTGLGVIPVALTRQGTEVLFGEMDQPISTAEPFPHEAELLTALGMARSELPIETYENGPRHVYVMLDSEEAVAALRPDITALSRFEGYGINCFAGSGSQWKSRMFAPGLGVVEDPATGSAAGPLAIHLVRHGLLEYGQAIQIRQGVEILRPSVLHARVEGADGVVERVVVGGAAVVVARGEYRVG